MVEDIEVQAMNDTYDLAKKDAEEKFQKLQGEVGAIREDARTLGVLQKINYDTAHNQLIKYSMLYQIRQSKEYKSSGMTWELYCEAAGENVRNVNRQLKDLRLFYDQFQGTLSCFLEVPISKIKYLGRTMSEKQDTLSQNGELILGEEKIPLTPDNKEEIEAAIDTIIETHKKEQKDLKNKLSKARKNTDKIIEEETKGLKHERDALVKEVDRLKPMDITQMDITWCEEHLKAMQGICVEFEKAARKMMMDKRLHEDMHVQAKCESMINMMARAGRELQREWDEEFNGADHSDPDVKY